MRNWKEFIKKTSENKPRDLYIEALKFIPTKNIKALDIAAGALNETKDMLSKGFEVTAFDSSFYTKELASELASSKLKITVSSMQEYKYGIEEYNFMIAMFALPFIPFNEFNVTFKKIVRSLKPEGIFAFHLFGPNDDWSNQEDMTFHTKEQARELVESNGLELLKIKEHQGKGNTASGVGKYWQTLQIIAIKL